MIIKETLSNGVTVNKSAPDNDYRYVLTYSLEDNKVNHFYTDGIVYYKYSIEEFITEEDMINRCVELGLTYVE